MDLDKLDEMAAPDEALEDEKRGYLKLVIEDRISLLMDQIKSLKQIDVRIWEGATLEQIMQVMERENEITEDFNHHATMSVLTSVQYRLKMGEDPLVNEDNDPVMKKLQEDFVNKLKQNEEE